MARYVKTLILNKEPTQVEERMRHFLNTYGFVLSKKGDGYEKGKGLWEAKRHFSYRYENGVLTYEAWLNKDMDPSDGKFAASMIKKAYMAELSSFDQFILGQAAELPEVSYSAGGIYVGLVCIVLQILLLIGAKLVSLQLPLIALIFTIPNGTKSKAKVFAWIVIGVNILFIIYWILSACLNIILL